MSRHAALAVVCCLLVAKASAQQTSPALEFDPAIIPFADAWQFSVLDGEYRIVNHSALTRHIVSSEALVNGGSITVTPTVLPPGGVAIAKVRQDVGTRSGQTSFRFRVVTDDPENLERKLILKGFVQTAYEPEVNAVDFGMLDQRSGGTTELEVATREAAALAVLDVKDAPPWLTVESRPAVDPARATIHVVFRVLPQAPVGTFTGMVRLRTSLQQQPWLAVKYRGAVFADIVPASPTLDLGVLRLGVDQTRRLKLTSRSGAPFEVTSIDGAPVGMQVSVEPCAANGACQELVVHAKPTEKGMAAGLLLLHVKGQAKPLPLHLGALVADANTPIHDVPSSASTPEATPDDTARANPQWFTPPVTQAQQVPSAVRQIVVRWRARSETNIYGYVVYRATQREGPFVHAGPGILHVEDGPPGATNDYSFVDTSVENGKTYYYYIDFVSVGGKRQPFSSILTRSIAADAKAPDSP